MDWSSWQGCASSLEVLMTTNKQTWALGLMSMLMLFHLTFLGVKVDDPKEFQEAAKDYVAVILALLAPLPTK